MKPKYSLEEILYRFVYLVSLISLFTFIVSGLLIGEWNWELAEKSGITILALCIGKEYGKESR